MSGPKRNPDKLNTLGVIVIGICASVLVYVTIVALQAFYMKDTSQIQTMADYGGNDTTFRSQKTAALGHITEYGRNADGSFRVPIDQAMAAVVRDAKTDPAGLVPGTRSETPSAEPVYGRSKPIAAPAGAGSAAAGSADAGSAAGSAAPVAPTNTPVDPTGATPSTGSAAPQVPMTPTGGQGMGGGPSPTTGAKNPGAGAAPAAGANVPGAGSAGSAAKGNAP